MNRFFIILLFLVEPLLIKSQYSAIGDWTAYLPAKNVVSIAHNSHQIFSATPYNIMIFDKSDNSIEYYNKVNALSDNGIETIAYNNLTNTLIVGYTNGNLDLIQDNVSFNISEIKNATSVIGDKSINQIHPFEDKAFLACGFGIVVIDLIKKEVKETYVLGSGGNQNRINNLYIQNDTIYAGTADGLFHADVNNPFLNDFSSWNQDISVPNASREITKLTYINGHAVINQKNNTCDSVYYKDGVNWINLLPNYNTRNTFLGSENGRLMVAHQDSVTTFDQNLTKLDVLYRYLYRTIQTQSCFYDGTKYIIGDSRYGLSFFVQDYEFSFLDINSPYNNSVHSLESVGGNTWVATAPVVGSVWAPAYNIDGVFKLEGEYNKWVNMTVHEGFQGLVNDSGDVFIDFYAVAADPEDPEHAYLCTFSYGILEVKNNVIINHYDTGNSALQQNILHSYLSSKVAAADFDINGNLWMANSQVTNPLVVKTKENEWKALYCGNDFTNTILSNILVAQQNNYKWMSQEKAILVYDDGETPLDETDDQYKILRQEVGNGNLPSGVTCLAEDHDGEVWIGTDKGLAVIYSPESIFNGGDYDAQQILIEQDGNVQILLETEIITCIEIDGANRKWIGTIASGVYLLSPDGTEQIHHFTTENSPLLTNEIKDISINELNGEVFIGTTSGIISYKSDATEGGNKYDNVYSYPNPVEPSYTGPIAIKGLMENSEVRITDAAGNIVYITKSLGGQAIWYGKDINGEKVASGIYFVFMANETGSQKFATKILFLN